MTASTLPSAYAAAETITREQARNFYYGIRLLAAPKRSALCAVYALARRIDDIGDGDLPAPEKLAALSRLQEQLDNIEEAASAGDPVLQAVADVTGRYPVGWAEFHELIDGVRMDVIGRTYRTFDELVGYCRCVAGSVGRLCLGVFGSNQDPAAAGYADTLGIALQQTNILRDIREDLINGRVYLPREDLDRFGVSLELDSVGALADPDDGLARLIRFSAARARTWYDDGLRLLPLLDRRSAACCAAMAGIYRRLLAEIECEPHRVFAQRLSLSGRDKAAVAVRALVGRAP